jgi:uncharacterized protein (DUF488 family)
MARREFEGTAAGARFPFFTIGHSTRRIGEFLDLLTASEIGMVVDVRTVPRSRTNPQFNRESLHESLSGFQIAYEHIAELGGLRARAKDIAPDVNALWQNQSFHNYADYAMSGSFRSGLARLRDLGRARRCAVMCAEAVWWRCHRRIISDYLVVAGEQVSHILGPGKLAVASLTPGAVAGPQATVIYPLPGAGAGA